jgi:hypothetical protein
MFPEGSMALSIGTRSRTRGHPARLIAHLSVGDGPKIGWHTLSPAFGEAWGIRRQLLNGLRFHLGHKSRSRWPSDTLAASLFLSTVVSPHFANIGRKRGPLVRFDLPLPLAVTILLSSLESAYGSFRQ